MAADRTVRPTVYERRQLPFWAVGTVLLLLPPLFTQGIYGLSVFRLVLIYCMISLGYWVQFAVTGSFSLATATFYATGAYLSAVNRAQAAVTNYPDAPATEQALLLMVRCYDKLGITDLRDDAERVFKKNFPDSALLRGEKKSNEPWWKIW